MRIDKFLANMGVGTRTEVKQLLKSGSVFINEQKEEAKDIFVMRYYFCDSIKRIAY